MDKINGLGAAAEKEWEEKMWRKFLEEIENAGSKHETSKFLDSILTESEKKIISRRLAAFALIKSGKSYREIGKILWISPCTISAINKIINDIGGYQSNREFRTKRINGKRRAIRRLPPSTILDYWASMPLPSKSGFRKNKKK